jgi:hypothetical protein
MRIDKISMDVYVAVPDEIARIAELTGQEFTADRVAVNLVGALGMVLNQDTVTGLAVQSAETLTAEQWEEAQVMIAQGCGHCDGCKARAEAEQAWADNHGIVL